MSDYLKFRYELDIHGWSDLYLDKGEISHAIRITHTFDCPVESLIQFVKDIKAQSYPSNIVLHDEPGSHILNLSVPQNGTPILKVFRTRDNFQSIDQAELIGVYAVNPGFLAQQILAELSKIKILMKHKVYQKDRSYFPAHLLKQL